MEEDGLVYWRTRILAALITTGLVLGFLGFIQKPFNMGELSEKIESSL